MVDRVADRPLLLPTVPADTVALIGFETIDVGPPRKKLNLTSTFPAAQPAADSLCHRSRGPPASRQTARLALDWPEHGLEIRMRLNALISRAIPGAREESRLRRYRRGTTFLPA